jgi:hypothetical protein
VAQEQTLRVKGYKEFLRACDRSGKATKKEVRAVFRKVGEGTRREAAATMLPIDARTSAGYKVRVRQRGVAVEQSIRKTTGLRPQYGALQMVRALLPALDHQDVDKQMGVAIDEVARIFERGGP